MSGDLRLCWRIARQELRGGLSGFGVFLTCLALAVAALAAVGTVRAAIQAGLARDGAVVDLTDGARVTTPEGWWLLRASNTQAMLTVRSEARTDDAVASLLAAVDAYLAACGVTRA